MKAANIHKPCRVAGQRLSARQPSVFGVSRCSKKLAASQTGNTIQEYGSAACQRQMNIATIASSHRRRAKRLIFELQWCGRRFASDVPESPESLANPPLMLGVKTVVFVSSAPGPVFLVS